MIRVAVYTEASGEITAFEVDGHAHYADPGQDIVCAGVSAVTIGTTNALEKLLEIDPDVEAAENGYLYVRLPQIDDRNVKDKAQLLLRSMLITLESIEQSYGSYVKVHYLFEGGKSTC